MAKTLKAGPFALSQHTLPALAALTRAPSLRALAENYVPDDHGGRLVLGPTGIGKTVAGVAVIRRRIERRLDGKPTNDTIDGRSWAFSEESPPLPEAWARALDLPNARLQASLGQGEAKAVTVAAGAWFLVLHDMGWESKRANADDVVLEVLAKRYDAGLPTYVTCGLTKQEFVARYGEAIIRRIVEAGGKTGKVIDLWGQA